MTKEMNRVELKEEMMVQVNGGGGFNKNFINPIIEHFTDDPAPENDDRTTIIEYPDGGYCYTYRVE